MVVAEIHVFPVKAFAGMSPHEAVVEPWGLRHDRRWLVVDDTGRFITQRTAPRMALIGAEATLGGLRLGLSGGATIDVAEPGPGAPRIGVTVWRNTLEAAVAGDEVNAWISTVLAQSCRLVHMDDTAARPLNPAYGRPGETVSFADGYPVLLTSLSSLADLNARLDRPVSIDRFRGNIVVGGAPAWAEDGWRLIRIGGATFRTVKPCERCIVTTIDQRTGERPDRAEPLRTLGTFRHDERGIMFGQNLVPETLGGVSVGDAIEILQSGPSNVQPLGVGE